MVIKKNIILIKIFNIIQEELNIINIKIKLRKIKLIIKQYFFTPSKELLNRFIENRTILKIKQKKHQYYLIYIYFFISIQKIYSHIKKLKLM